jgi:carbon catabolite-derepressing protein kinase
MDLQLYRVDAQNYLVDFRNVGYYRTHADKPGFERLVKPKTPTEASSVEPGEGAPPASNAPEGGSKGAGGIEGVCSPFLFLDCATKLIAELAGG